MVKQCFKFMVAAALVVISGSFAKADTYSIVSSWSTGSTANNNLIQFTGDGTFTWNGSTFSNISFTFTETSAATGACGPASYQYPCVTLPTVLWTATANDGELNYPSPHDLILGNGVSDCGGPSCVTILLSGPLALGGTSAPVLTGLSGNGAYTPLGMQNTHNEILVSATVTDLPEPSAIAVLGTVSGILGFVIFRRRKLIR